ncbi:MAG TPA: carboxypeptidase-like regulatory domain-containing protein [Bryobacteraceae bacterium]|nr:carboxypeptidase-like regulatory domain-containing protein [Bryobacteraceae bacterium]
MLLDEETRLFRRRPAGAAAPIACWFAAVVSLWAAGASVAGRLTDPQGKPVTGARVRVSSVAGSSVQEMTSGSDGTFEFSSLPAGLWKFTASGEGFAEISRTIRIFEGQTLNLNLRFDRIAARAESVTITADLSDRDIGRPDPAQRVLVRDEILDANPGRPGAPVSIPGIPTETASGGIKAPQYFAPGVAGDHGEPIAQFIQVGTYLAPNNLSANAHGNGYSDPNIMVPAIIESVQTDGGAFNVREGNHSVDLSATYVLRPAVQPFVTLTADRRDVDVSAGWNWIAVEASYGNGFLDTPEHRQQYKINGLKGWEAGGHRLTLLTMGYYGQSAIPGLVPVDVPHLHDTIDPRQRDQTHTGEAVLNDVWRLGSGNELQLSGFFRTYNLSLTSDFGDGLIRQSEFRTVAGGNATWVRKFNAHFSAMAGLDSLREAPRRDNLDRYESTDPAIYGPFQKVTANNLTLDFVTSFAAVDGSISSWLRYNLGWRRDQIRFDNEDLLNPEYSFHKWVGFNSPKATLNIVAPKSLPLPSVALSFGQSFFTNDPRIGMGTQQGSPVSRAHAWQAVISRILMKTDFRVVLGHTTQESSLAKIDADTGLQFDEGPGVNRYITVSARRYFGAGLLQASVSKADARDLSTGAPIPEAPRLIVDVLGTLDRLPWHLHARAEFEEVGRKPLSDGFVSVPVREFRGALVRSFHNERIQTGVHFQLASGFGGQTTEALALPGEGDPFERVVGVYIPSYATLSFSYRFSH